MRGYILLGSPGGGKGTLGQFMEKTLHIEHFSSGDILRHEVRQQTTIGKEIQYTLDEGKHVSDQLITSLVLERINQFIHQNKTFVLDGFPQTMAQVESLRGFLQSHPEYPVTFICVRVEPETALKRMIGRITCINCNAIYHKETLSSTHNNQCGICDGQLVERKSDTHEVALKRLQQFEVTAKKVIDSVLNDLNVFFIDGNVSPLQVQKQLLNILK